MIEVAVAVWFLLVGLGLSLAARPHVPLVICYALALPTGVAAYGVAAWVLLVFGVPVAVPTAIAVVSAIGVTVPAVRWRRLALPARTVALLSAWSLVLTAGLAVIFQVIHAADVSPDSLRYLITAAVLADHGSIADVREFDVINRHLIEGVLHSPGAWTAPGYLRSFHPVFGAAGLIAFGALVDLALRRFDVTTAMRAALVVVSVTFVLSTNRGVYNLFYVHGHMLFAVYLMIVVCTVWLAAQDRSGAWLVFAVPPVALLVGLRAEAFLVVALVLVAAVADHRVSTRACWWLVGTYAASILLWYGGVIRPLMDGFSHADGAIAVALALIAFTGGVRRGPLRRVATYMPYVAVAGLVALLLVFVVVDPSVFKLTVDATVENLTGAGRWRLTWIGLPLLMAAATALSRMPSASIWWTVLVGFVPLFFLFPYLREAAYRVGPGDSGNRMLMHVLLLAVAYTVVAVGSSYRGRTPEETGSAGTPVPSR